MPLKEKSPVRAPVPTIFFKRNRHPSQHAGHRLWAALYMDVTTYARPCVSDPPTERQRGSSELCVPAHRREVVCQALRSSVDVLHQFQGADQFIGQKQLSTRRIASRLLIPKKSSYGSAGAAIGRAFKRIFGIWTKRDTPYKKICRAYLFLISRNFGLPSVPVGRLVTWLY